MKNITKKFTLLISLIMLCSLILSGCSSGTGTTSSKTLDNLKLQSLSNYGKDITIADAVANLFDKPTWGTGDGSAESDGRYKIVLSGIDKNGNDWIVNFYCSDEEATSWECEVTKFNNFIFDDAGYGTELLMKYLTTTEANYKDGFEQIYYCGYGNNKSYNISDMISSFDEEVIDLTLTEDANKYISRYDRLIPCTGNYIPEEYVDWDITINDLKKNINRYSDKFMFIQNLTIQEIVEQEYASDEYITLISASDNNLNFYLLINCGEMPDFYDGDQITALALPIGQAFMSNMIGGQTEYTVYLICDAAKPSSAGDITVRIKSPEERYDESLSYAGELTDSSYEEVVEPEDAPDDQSLMTDSMMLMFELEPDFSTSEFSFSHNGTDADGMYSVFTTDYDEETYLKIYPEIGLIYYSVTDVNDGEHSEVILMENFEYTGAW